MTAAGRARSLLAYGFAISIALHLIAGPFVRRAHGVEARVIAPDLIVMTRPPAPLPTPRPTPAATPTPTPAAVRAAAPARHRVALAVRPPRAEARGSAGPAEAAYVPSHGDPGGAPDAAAGTAPEAPASDAATVPPLPPPTPTPLACARPFVAPGTDRTVEPELPPLAQQQGIGGDVRVVVSLTENDRVAAVAVQSSPSRLLNDAALAAARGSTFHTEVRNCRKVAADYLFIVSFSAQ